MKQIQIQVSGMTCGGCVKSVQNALQARDGVSEATADLASGNVTVAYDPAQINPQALQQAIVDAGFEVT